MNEPRTLAIETSCDDTSVAVVDQTGYVWSVCSTSQDLTHEPFGGIVPELASRNHTLQLLPLIEQVLSEDGCSWDRLSGIAVTSRPGLVGSLMVGVVTAKSLALVKGLPLVGVNHIEGHLLAPFLRDDRYAPPKDFDFPYVALAVSGGHTHLFLVEDVGRYRILGRTVDDAAGEAFDKFAKWIQLGYPGGALVDREAKQGDPTAFSFPRAMMREGDLFFSFSGLKTAAAKILNELGEDEAIRRRPDLCASFQKSITDVLLAKLAWAAKSVGAQRVVITGGVSANSWLRSQGEEMAQREGLLFVVPPLRYCTDNAAMIGYAGVQKLKRGYTDGQGLSPSAAADPRDYLEADH